MLWVPTASRALPTPESRSGADGGRDLLAWSLESFYPKLFQVGSLVQHFTNFGGQVLHVL